MIQILLSDAVGVLDISRCEQRQPKTTAEFAKFTIDKSRLFKLKSLRDAIPAVVPNYCLPYSSFLFNFIFLFIPFILVLQY